MDNGEKIWETLRQLRDAAKRVEELRRELRRLLTVEAEG